jgi:hypothetical protein
VALRAPSLTRAELSRLKDQSSLITVAYVDDHRAFAGYIHYGKFFTLTHVEYGFYGKNPSGARLCQYVSAEMPPPLSDSLANESIRIVCVTGNPPACLGQRGEYNLGRKI